MLSYVVPIIGVLGLLVFLVNLVFIIIAGLQAKQGIEYRYPFNIRLVKQFPDRLYRYCVCYDASHSTWEALCF